MEVVADELLARITAEQRLLLRAVLLPGDHAYIFARPEERQLIQLMFGRPEA